MNSASQTAIFRWKPSTWLRVHGADAGSFLQGQFTNDLRPLFDHTVPAVYGLWLSVKGKVLADSFILKDTARPDGFWLCSYFCPPDMIRERLESHVIADDVTIEDETGHWSALTVFGPTETRLEDQVRAAGRSFSGRRARLPHKEWITPEAVMTEIQRTFGPHRELTREDMEAARIDSLIPAVPVDLGPTDLPNEGALEAEAISYTKGCYLGQEVMARLKTMGQVRRRLLRVRGAGPVPTVPAPLFADGRQVGELRSAIATTDGMRGLAMLTLMHVKPGALLSFTASGEPQLQLETMP